MKLRAPSLTLALTLALALALGIATPAWADPQGDLNAQARQMDGLAVSQGASRVSTRIGSDFNAYYGDNTDALVTGLRSGQAISLPANGTGSAVEIPARPQTGYGNVYITLSLAQQRLAASGLQPPYTSEQVGSALMGDTTGQGILQMRADGMGWGQIAQSLGTKLGPVVSGMKTANTGLVTATSPTTGTTSTALGSGGTVAGNKGKPGSAGGSNKGITTAGGAGQGKGGIVTGSGAPGGNAGVNSAGGQGHGLQKGLGKAGKP